MFFQQSYSNIKPPFGTQLNSSHPLTKSICGIWAFNEGAGSIVLDPSGNNNIGELIGAPVWVNGKFGGALDFNGSSDYIFIDKALVTSTPATFCAWINLHSLASLPQRIITIHEDGTLNDLLSLGINVLSRVQAQQQSGGGTAGIAVSTTGLSINTKYFVCAVFESNSLRHIYVNGVLEGSNTKAEPVLAGLNYTSIGNIRWSPGNTQHFNGLIDCLVTYDRALTATEVAWLYREPWAMFGYYTPVWAFTSAGRLPLLNSGLTMQLSGIERMRLIS